jgi:hypothetical protein
MGADVFKALKVELSLAPVFGKQSEMRGIL